MRVIASEARLARWTARERPRPAAVGRWRRWLPRWTVRLRLTLLYGVLFLAAGAGLLAITYGLVVQSQDTGPKMFVVRGGKLRTAASASDRRLGFVFQQKTPSGAPPPVPPGLGKFARRIKDEAFQKANANQRSALLTTSGIALAIMALISIGLGWLMAGRVLRPLRTMNARVREISAHNLHQRLAIEGHDDELRELGDAFDGLLGRLERAFESQRRFVANASHELRTPVTLERALLEVALSDPHADAEALREVCSRVLRAGEQQERTINALLTLARSERGLDAREEFDLGEVASEAVAGADIDGARIDTELRCAPASGDAALTERLVANLVENAVRHNDERGWIRVATGDEAGYSVLRVSNTGPVLTRDQVSAMHEPFTRLNGERTGHGAGVGLGLSIVDAIAKAHGAAVRTEPREAGGLDVEVTFPSSEERVLHRLYTA